MIKRVMMLWGVASAATVGAVGALLIYGWFITKPYKGDLPPFKRRQVRRVVGQIQDAEWTQAADYLNRRY